MATRMRASGSIVKAQVRVVINTRTVEDIRARSGTVSLMDLDN
jgi:hypothetical protein